jgi:N-methylhydantoinase A
VLRRADIEARFTALEKRALRESPSARIERTADLRYRGQSYELNVPWASAIQRFHREHAKIYGYSLPERDVEIVTIRVRARTAVPRPKLATAFEFPRPHGSKDVAPIAGIRGLSPICPTGNPEFRRVWTGKWRRLPVWKRDHIGSTSRKGPALVLDYGSTTLIPAGWRFQVDCVGNLVIQRV